MKNIYKTPDSNLDMPEKKLGPMPKEAWYVFFIFCIEEALTLMMNYTDYYSEPALELLEPISIILSSLTVIVLGYIWYLLVNGKKFLKVLTLIFIAIEAISIAVTYFNNEVTYEIEFAVVLLSTGLLLVIAALYKTTELSNWLTEK